MASLLQPSSYNRLNSIIGLTSGTAQGQMGQYAPGVGDIRTTMGALENGPQTVLPGGGTLEGPSEGRLRQFEQTETPAATLPLYQGEAGRQMGLSGVAAGASGLQSREQVLNTSRLGGFQQLLQQLLPLLSPKIGPLQAGGVGGAFGLLGQILGI